MSEFKGTPGPWVVSDSDRSIGVISKDDDQSYGMIKPTAWVEFLLDKDEQKANANLIAAAPELLEALLRVRSQFDQSGIAPVAGSMSPVEDNYAFVNQVITKALGE